MIQDDSGNEIFLGSDVVYNRSGTLVRGVVVKIKPKWTVVAWHPHYQWVGHFIIQQTATGEDSRVKNPSSIHVIPTL